MGMLEQRIALVTGGRGGVGRAVCDRFAHEGATVYAADLSDGGSLGDEGEASGSYLRLDVTSEDDVVAVMISVQGPVGEVEY